MNLRPNEHGTATAPSQSEAIRRELADGRASMAGAVRAFGVVFGGPLVLDAAGAAAEAPRGVALAFYVLQVELPHFVMERKMLLGIKRRAEAAALSARHDRGGARLEAAAGG